MDTGREIWFEFYESRSPPVENSSSQASKIVTESFYSHQGPIKTEVFFAAKNILDNIVDTFRNILEIFQEGIYQKYCVCRTHIYSTAMNFVVLYILMTSYVLCIPTYH